MSSRLTGRSTLAELLERADAGDPKASARLERLAETLSTQLERLFAKNVGDLLAGSRYGVSEGHAGFDQSKFETDLDVVQTAEQPDCERNAALNRLVQERFTIREIMGTPTWVAGLPAVVDAQGEPSWHSQMLALVSAAITEIPRDLPVAEIYGWILKWLRQNDARRLAIGLLARASEQPQVVLGGTGTESTEHPRRAGGRPKKTTLSDAERSSALRYKRRRENGSSKNAAAGLEGHDVETLEGWLKRLEE